jgi:glycosyltransferase involved in cell wall biosynthesis
MIRICYSGSLDGFDPNLKSSKKSLIKRWFWTFKNNNVDSSTRSGYYFIKAIAMLNEKRLISPKQIHVEWWGKINPLNQKQINQENLNDYFTIKNYLPKAESLKKIKNADILFLPLEKTNSSEHRTLFIPGKVFEYIETQKPILALCEDSDCKEIITKSGLGICVEPDNIVDISNVILKIVSDIGFLMEIKSNLEYIENYSFKVKTKELAEILNELENRNEKK